MTKQRAMRLDTAAGAAPESMALDAPAPKAAAKVPDAMDAAGDLRRKVAALSERVAAERRDWDTAERAHRSRLSQLETELRRANSALHGFAV